MISPETPQEEFQSAVEPQPADFDHTTGQPRGLCFAFVESDLLVLMDGAGGHTVPTWDDLRQWHFSTVRHQFLGALNGDPCWSVELPTHATPPRGAVLSGIRALFDQLSETHYALAGRAIQIIAWERDHQFCGRCGAPTSPVPGERARRCSICGLISYPRISPAIIVLIERGDRILLARGHAFASGRFGIIAGFVEPGESLEDAVRREVREEVGIAVTNVRYFGSQPWPFPHGIMIGFRADYAYGEISLDDGELAEADWYDFASLPNVPAKLSIARRLIDDWATRHGFTIDQP